MSQPPSSRPRRLQFPRIRARGWSTGSPEAGVCHSGPEVPPPHQPDRSPHTQRRRRRTRRCAHRQASPRIPRQPAPVAPCSHSMRARVRGQRQRLPATTYGRHMRVLVTGGAGYIGSHTVIQLLAAGHDVLIVDNFANAKPTVINRLESITGEHLVVHAFDLRDADRTEHLFAQERIDAVIHFAGHKAVGESVEKPLEYYENNLGSTFSLVGAMARHTVPKLVVSP